MVFKVSQGGTGQSDMGEAGLVYSPGGKLPFSTMPVGDIGGPWQKDGDNIYFNTGFVGINCVPGFPLEVSGAFTGWNSGYDTPWPNLTFNTLYPNLQPGACTGNYEDAYTGSAGYTDDGLGHLIGWDSHIVANINYISGHIDTTPYLSEAIDDIYYNYTIPGQAAQINSSLVIKCPGIMPDSSDVNLVFGIQKTNGEYLYTRGEGQYGDRLYSEENYYAVGTNATMKNENFYVAGSRIMYSNYQDNYPYAYVQYWGLGGWESLFSLQNLDINNGYTKMLSDGTIRSPYMPTSDPMDGSGTLWYDSTSRQIYMGT